MLFFKFQAILLYIYFFIQMKYNVKYDTPGSIQFYLGHLKVRITFHNQIQKRINQIHVSSLKVSGRFTVNVNPP